MIAYLDLPTLDWKSQAEFLTLEPKGNLLSIPASIGYREAAASLE